jgi:hypothetical protein
VYFTHHRVVHLPVISLPIHKDILNTVLQYCCLSLNIRGCCSWGNCEQDCTVIHRKYFGCFSTILVCTDHFTHQIKTSTKKKKKIRVFYAPRFFSGQNRKKKCANYASKYGSWLCRGYGTVLNFRTDSRIKFIILCRKFVKCGHLISSWMKNWFKVVTNVVAAMGRHFTVLFLCSLYRDAKNRVYISEDGTAWVYSHGLCASRGQTKRL